MNKFGARLVATSLNDDHLFCNREIMSSANWMLLDEDAQVRAAFVRFGLGVTVAVVTLDEQRDLVRDKFGG